MRSPRSNRRHVAHERGAISSWLLIAAGLAAAAVLAASAMAGVVTSLTESVADSAGVSHLVAPPYVPGQAAVVVPPPASSRILEWEPVPDADSYAIFRDGVQIAESETAAFLDLEGSDDATYTVAAFSRDGRSISVRNRSAGGSTSDGSTAGGGDSSGGGSSGGDSSANVVLAGDFGTLETDASGDELDELDELDALDDLDELDPEFDPDSPDYLLADDGDDGVDPELAELDNRFAVGIMNADDVFGLEPGETEIRDITVHADGVRAPGTFIQSVAHDGTTFELTETNPEEEQQFSSRTETFLDGTTTQLTVINGVVVDNYTTDIFGNPRPGDIVGGVRVPQPPPIVVRPNNNGGGGDGNGNGNCCSTEGQGTNSLTEAGDGTPVSGSTDPGGGGYNNPDLNGNPSAAG